jgi:hypothetical protein
MAGTPTIPELDRNGLRDFGLVTGAVVAVLFGLLFPWLLERDWPLWPWFIAAPLWTLAILSPSWLRLIYRAWMHFGLLASRVTTPLVLGAVFFLVLTPMAVWRRITGADPMQRKFEPDKKSYRVATQKAPAERLEKPF